MRWDTPSSVIGTELTVLILGSGAREHALAWKLSQSPRVGRLIIAPGNDGLPERWTRWPVRLTAADFPALARRAKEEKVDLVIVGPDNPLAEGVSDVFQEWGVPCFGPSAAAARLESSKSFAKEVMASAGVPTARHLTAATAEEAGKVLAGLDWSDGRGWVVKADGLALGKGVRVCASAEEAEQAAADLLGVNGGLLIEERLAGEEQSWLAFCDGERACLLEPARDYKRLMDQDRGPNTGGMGAFSPIEGLSPGFAERVRREVFEPVLAEMSRRGAPFLGVLYAGLMVDPSRERFWVLEFNVRFGDPEAQVLLPRMADDFLLWAQAVALGDLSGFPTRVPMLPEAAVYVVGASWGYPDKPERGRPIAGPLSQLDRASGVPHYFCAGVARADAGAAQNPLPVGTATGTGASLSGLMTDGGRIFGALGMGMGLARARAQAYERLKRVSFAGMQYRLDVAK